MSPSEMLERVRAHFQTFWHGDIADFDEQLSPDLIDASQPESAPAGNAAAKAFALALRAAFPDMQVTVDDFVASDDVIAVHARWRGTNTGPLMGRPATGKVLEFAGLVMWRFDAQGRIDRRWTQLDLPKILARFLG